MQKRQEVLKRLAARAERKYGNADTEYRGQYPPQMMRWRAFRIVALVLKALLVLSTSFAPIALGIFVLGVRFGRPGPLRRSKAGYRQKAKPPMNRRGLSSEEGHLILLSQRPGPAQYKSHPAMP